MDRFVSPSGRRQTAQSRASFVEPTVPRTSSVRLGANRPMNAQDAMKRLRGAWVEEGPDRYRLAFGKTFLFVRLQGVRSSIRYGARDHVAFRIDDLNLTVEDLRTHGVRKTIPWNLVESVAAGELESENSDLFQG